MKWFKRLFKKKTEAFINIIYVQKHLEDKTIFKLLPKGEINLNEYPIIEWRDKKVIVFEYQH